MDRLRGELTGLGLVTLLAGVLLGACRPADAAVDRPVAPDVALARFRAGLPQPAGLTGGEESRDALVARFIRALETSDTAALAAMTLSVAEFAWWYYPTNPQSRPPYDLPPELMWFLLRGNGDKGLGRLLADRAGRPLDVVGYRCDAVVSREGDNTVSGPCVIVRRAARGETVEERLFGLILERGGRYKFVSYANRL